MVEEFGRRIEHLVQKHLYLRLFNLYPDAQHFRNKVAAVEGYPVFQGVVKSHDTP
jgi:hypothetical protein